MSLENRSRSAALVLATVPGWGHVYWGQETRGLSFFTLAGLAGFVLVNAAFIYVGAWRSVLVVGASLGLLSIVTWSWLDILRLTAADRIQADLKARQEAMREGTLAYLKNDLPAAAACFESCLRRDPLDLEALFRLGVVLARSGDAHRARALWRRAARLDDEGKWEWEIRRQLSSLDARTAAPAEAVTAGAPSQEERV